MRANWKSGLTVGLVSIPIAVSLAVASNASPVSGIITAFWAGIIASIFGGSNYNIIGPTSALSGLLFMYASVLGPECLPILAIISGIFILVGYTWRVEKYLAFLPGSALHGFILGVALMIFLTQINPALGLPKLVKHESLVANALEALKNIHLISWPSFGLFIIFLIGLLFFAKYTPRLPGTIILAPVGIVVGYLCVHGYIPWTIPTLGSKYPNIYPTLIQIPHFTLSVAYILPGFSIAAISTLETMISGRIADGITKTKHHKRKELLGLGLANIASGFAGGIPATAALARTALNIRSGSTDKMSATISSICIAIISLIFLQCFRFIPLAVIAAILVFVSLRMLEAEHFFRMFKVDKKNFTLSLIVAFVTVYEDPIIGILLGAIIAMLLFMEKLSDGYHEIMLDKRGRKIKTEPVIQAELNIYIYAIKGPLAYINAQAHIARIEQIPEACSDVILDLRDVHFIDLDGIEAFGEMVMLMQSKGKAVAVAQLNPVVAHFLQESQVFNALKKNSRIFSHVQDAIIQISA